MNGIKIINASEEDAHLIAWAIMEAVGKEIVDGLAGDKTREDVESIFSRLARRTDSQYSYLNTRIALTREGKKAGVCISYDGGELRRLRRSFFEEANRLLGWNMTDDEIEAVPGETCEEEFYLDSLAILPEFRGRGIGRLLIEDASEKAGKHNLPLGLLVADGNHEARKLYEKCGFKPVSRRLFAGEEMTNMRREV